MTHYHHQNSRLAYLSRTLPWLLLALLPLTTMAVPDWVGTNLWPNAHLESPGPDGLPAGWERHQKAKDAWIIDTDKEAGVAGPHCLQLRRVDPAAPNPEQAWFTAASPVLTVDPGWYMVSFWVRHDYAEDRLPHRMVYINILRGNPASPERSRVHHGYYLYSNLPPSGGWRWQALVVRIKPEEIGLQLGFQARHIGRAMYLDAFQLRRLHMPVNGERHFEARFYNKHGRDTELVSDPDASLGHAWRFVEDRNQSGRKLGTPHGSTLSTPGLYWAEWRLKTLTAGGTLDFHVGGIDTFDNVSAEEMPVSDDYHVVRVPIVAPVGQHLSCEFFWDGKGGYQLDHVSLWRVRDIDPLDGRQIFYQDIDLATALGEIPGPAAEGDVWLAFGPYTEQTGIVEAIAEAGLQSAVSHIGQARGGEFILQPPMPDLSTKKMAVLADVPIRLLSPHEQFALRRFVERGGALIVSGGLLGFGHGGLRTSLLADVLPVRTTGNFDLLELPDAKFVKTEQFHDLGRCQWVHHVEATEDAKVVARAGDHPIVVRGIYGQGRVLAIPGTVLGTPQDPWWRTDGWHALLRKQFAWLINTPTATKE